MKKNVYLLALILLLTGCSVERINYTTYENTIYKVLNYNTALYNVSLEGYHYYLPKGATLVNKNDTNSIIKYNSMNLYLYVDVVSYYHKSKNEFMASDSYYSKKIEYNDKFGYLEITKYKDVYFVELMYNYAKIEGFVKKELLHDTIHNITLILSSIEYNDAILESLVGENTLNYSEESFDILKPKKDTDNNNYLDYEYEQIYEEYEGEIKDEDSIEILEDEER